MMMKKLSVLAVILFAAVALAAQEQAAADREAVRRAVLDYVEGVYNVDPSRIERSVSPNLAKIGFYRGPNDADYRAGNTMTFERLKEVAKNYNREGKLRKDAPKEVIIYEVLDKTASVKLVAEWGIDYMHLAKLNGRWMIVNVMWQSHPKPQS
jgi:hypothetical protein